ncbi:hypothetical protein AJ79_09993 [Helicocarpus griseus UAMH5409]|uniref:Uncharacterized protein n=1 Tax=Helicocarpus griseus UAMH5409 TaxID=1447875 RepID=A0A2B7WG98_9EURO|nr:hypothetical protein AJ79_09993 [Helicocarpus griseus UAMH5409]
MGTFTCQDMTDAVALQHRHLSSIHMHDDNTISSPFLYIDPFPRNDVNIDVAADSSSYTHYANAPETTLSCCGISSDAKSYYTAVEVADVTMQQRASPAISELGPLTPGTTFSATSGEISPIELGFVSKRSTDSPGKPNASPRSRRHSYYREAKPNASESRTSSCSTTRRRSSSQDIPSRSSSVSRRKASKHHSHKTGANAHIHCPTSRRADPSLGHKRADLVSLHRDSCRLFEGSLGATNTSAGRRQYDARAGASEWIRPRRAKLNRSNTAPTERITIASIAGSFQARKPFSTASPPLSPCLNSPTLSPVSPTSPEGQFSPNSQINHHRDPVLRESFSHSELPREDLQERKPIPATVIDWTSPSTRRREYEKIDRSTRGVRGMWRRFAPSWCQPGDSRTPFFEEGKGGKDMYEGSVRRFRMDVPDDDDDNDTSEAEENDDPGGKGKAQLSLGVKWRWTDSISPAGSLRGRGGHGKWRCLGSITRKTSS